MKSFVCVLFLCVLTGSYAFSITNDSDKKLVRVRRTVKIFKKDCDRNLALASTGIGGLAGAGVGAGAGAIAGSVVPGIGTAIGAGIGNYMKEKHRLRRQKDHIMVNSDMLI